MKKVILTCALAAMLSAVPAHAAPAEPRYEQALAAFVRGDASALAVIREYAEKGYHPAQGALGASYASGQGVPQDFAQAVYWYQKSAAQGNKLAQTNLASLYLKGKGVEKDPAKAKALYEKAAAQGDALAEYHLGMMYLSGNGVQRNEKTAVSWFEKAGKRGHAQPQTCWASCMKTVPKAWRKITVKPHIGMSKPLNVTIFLHS